MYGTIYVKTIRLEKVKEKLTTELSNLQSENEGLNVRFLSKNSPAEIDNLARTKYNMGEPNSFYIIEETQTDGK